MIYPSIDLQNGRAVQLRQGREKVLERDNPLELAAEFSRFGPLAVIDLDRALEGGANDELVKAMVKKYPCRVGGGIRQVERAVELLAAGAEKVIVSTAVFRDDGIDFDFLDALEAAVGAQQVIIAVDSLDGEIVTGGWRRRTGLQVLETAPRLEPYCGEFLYTDVGREGSMSGIEAERAAGLRALLSRRLTVAGGIGSLPEVSRLSALGLDLQLGMALYTGRFSAAEAFMAALDWSKGLLPTITVDEEGRVLMLAWSDRESLANTLAGGLMHYHSRSRSRLWRKGESSGNEQELVRLRVDCDNDSLLATVRPKGPACHYGDYSCFGPRPFSLGQLQAVIRERLTKPRPGSYTASLDRPALAEKIMEEAAELIATQTREEVIWEAADLLYFTISWLTRHNVSLDEVIAELRRRRKK